MDETLAKFLRGFSVVDSKCMNPGLLPKRNKRKLNVCSV